SFACSREYDLRIRRMHQQLVGATRAEWNPRELRPLFTGRSRAINSTARVHVNHIGIARKHVDPKDIRVIYHTDRFVAGLFPGEAAVGGFPRKVPRADVDDPGVA